MEYRSGSSGYIVEFHVKEASRYRRLRPSLYEKNVDRESYIIPKEFSISNPVP